MIRIIVKQVINKTFGIILVKRNIEKPITACQIKPIKFASVAVIDPVKRMQLTQQFKGKDNGKWYLELI